uniref:Uncharacterized protein n=1 Tax=Arundo donax TaxID=35708 RepID=A0A0A8Y6Z7_ARUDO
MNHLIEGIRTTALSLQDNSFPPSDMFMTYPSFPVIFSLFFTL